MFLLTHLVQINSASPGPGLFIGWPSSGAQTDIWKRSCRVRSHIFTQIIWKTSSNSQWKEGWNNKFKQHNSFKILASFNTNPRIFSCKGAPSCRDVRRRRPHRRYNLIEAGTARTGHRPHYANQDRREPGRCPRRIRLGPRRPLVVLLAVGVQ